MSENKSAMLAKIRALFNKAERTDNPHEAEAYTARANALMVKYAIDAAVLDAAATTGREAPTVRTLPVPAPYATPKHALLTGVGTVFGVKVYLDRRGGARSAVMRLVGFPTDLDVVEMTYTSLLVQGTNACAGGSRAYRNAWWMGYAQRVCERLSAQHAEAVTEAQSASGGAPGASLVLADRAEVVARAAAGLVGGSKVTRSRRDGGGGDEGGYHAGVAAGDRADLGRGRVTGGRTAIAGQG